MKRLPLNNTTLSSLPEIPAIYIIRDKRTVKYIGQTRNLLKRWQYHHLVISDLRKVFLNTYTIEYLKASTLEKNRKAKESELIRTLKSEWNDGRALKLIIPGTKSLNSYEKLEQYLFSWKLPPYPDFLPSRHYSYATFVNRLRLIYPFSPLQVKEAFDREVNRLNTESLNYDNQVDCLHKFMLKCFEISCTRPNYKYPETYDYLYDQRDQSDAYALMPYPRNKPL